jgi:hypothetical protein
MPGSRVVDITVLGQTIKANVHPSMYVNSVRYIDNREGGVSNLEDAIVSILLFFFCLLDLVTFVPYTFWVYYCGALYPKIAQKTTTM